MIPQADPLFQLKRRLLQRHNLATQQTFQLLRGHVSTFTLLIIPECGLTVQDFSGLGLKLSQWVLAI